jgi:hypothetical protein
MKNFHILVLVMFCVMFWAGFHLWGIIKTTAFILVSLLFIVGIQVLYHKKNNARKAAYYEILKSIRDKQFTDERGFLDSQSLMNKLRDFSYSDQVYAVNLAHDVYLMTMVNPVKIVD